MDNVTVQHIIDFAATLGLETLIGANANLAETITTGKSINIAKQGQVTFLSSKFADTAEQLLQQCQSNIIVLEDTFKPIAPATAFPAKSFIFSAEPKNTINIILRHFFSAPVEHIIHPTAVVSAKAVLGKNVNIGPYSVVEDNVTIGDDTFIASHVHIQRNCTVGSNVVIKSSTVIGNSGFGLVKNEAGEYAEFPHFGAVHIADNVQIGSNVCIDRGSLNDTIIHKGVKVDNLVHIAHNVEIGENTLVIANTMIGGSTKIGANCWIAPSVSLRNNIVIGDNTTVGLGSVVTKSFENEREIAGVPARKLDEFKALLDQFKKLI
jgi:UDP-3-O-[3-hydroxymyristoyl] glucosamine N-acyltransferase